MRGYPKFPGLADLWASRRHPPCLKVPAGPNGAMFKKKGWDQNVGVSLNGGTPKTPQNGHFY